jgi:hypothetical protein
MTLAIECPHCGVRKVDSAAKAWFIQGFVFLARDGVKAHVGRFEWRTLAAGLKRSMQIYLARASLAI